MTINTVSEQDLGSTIARQIDAAISSAAIRAEESIKKTGPMALTLNGHKLHEAYMAALGAGDELKRAIGDILSVASLVGRGGSVTAVGQPPAPQAFAPQAPMSPEMRDMPQISMSLPVTREQTDARMTAVVVNDALIDQKSRAVTGVSYSSAIKGLAATVVDTGDGIVILEGSQIHVPEASNLTSPQYLSDRETILRTAVLSEDGIRRLDRDFKVKSFTAAMSVVTGMNRNGSGWVDAEGNAPASGHGMKPEALAAITNWTRMFGASPTIGKRKYASAKKRFYAPAPSVVTGPGDARFTLDEANLNWLLEPGLCGYLLLAFGGGVIQVHAGMIEFPGGSAVIKVTAINAGSGAEVVFGKGKALRLNIEIPDAEK
ncbi:hypothetical protein [Paracoccus sp. ME4]|uniref:hypothetical protein n=1 Tax=Paracoccus sp. ME4 TaxID=3138066 RepID=UPI00398A9F8B